MEPDKPEDAPTIHITFTSCVEVWRRVNGVSVPASELDRARNPFVLLRDIEVGGNMVKAFYYCAHCGPLEGPQFTYLRYDDVIVRCSMCQGLLRIVQLIEDKAQRTGHLEVVWDDA